MVMRKEATSNWKTTSVEVSLNAEATWKDDMGIMHSAFQENATLIRIVATQTNEHTNEKRSTMRFYAYKNGAELPRFVIQGAEINLMNIEGILMGNKARLHRVV